MELSSTSANSSFGSTASSTTPSPPHAPHSGDATAADAHDDDEHVVTIKEEPANDADAYDRTTDWAHIFDENGVMCLDVDDDDDPMDAADVAADPRRSVTSGGSAGSGGSSSGAAARGAAADAFYRHPETALHEPTPSSALLDNWGYYDTDMLSPASQPPDVGGTFVSPMGLAPSNLAPPPSAAFFDPASGPSDLKSEMVMPPRVPTDCTDGVTSAPLYTVALGKQNHGQPFPLSKPLMRDDGLLVVGTELAPDSSSSASAEMSNCIFITRIGSPQEAPHVIKTSADVRGLEWLSRSAAVAAIGSDIHLLLLDANDNERGNLCTLTVPMRRVHADTIRELAVLYGGRDRPTTIASGGFDETVVLTKLGEGGDPGTAKIDGKIDAYDVVSSLRWHPTETGMLSWTTDGGDFQIADVRARTKPQLQVALSSFLEIDHLGGLFSHEYISPSNVVLGFQSGQLLFLDLRMPRKQYCYGVMKSPLACVGEMRRSVTGSCVMFGVGGFATATVDSLGRELASLAGARPPHSSKVGFHNYKTSGDFSYESRSFYAVSDSLGVVSVYATNTSSVNAGSTAASATASDREWQAHAM